MDTTLLRRALFANAGFSLLSGVTFVGFSDKAAGVLGGAPSLAYFVVGVMLLGFAASVAWTAVQDDRASALAISIADIGWVIATFVLAWVLPFTFEGVLAIGIINAFVASFAVGQLAGIAKSYRVDEEYELCIRHVVPMGPQRMFAVVADLAGIENHAPNLASTVLRNTDGVRVGAVRECTSIKGERWAEEVSRLDHETRVLNVKFLTDEPEFPFPFRTMIGGWVVTDHPEGSEVRVWWRVTMQRKWTAALILPLMALQARRDMSVVIDSMAGASNRGRSVRAAFC